ncbi:MAG: TrbC/VirB2 family protein [Vitreoscilla sp.]|nr:TrbC/VirB2 family protein [Vitreoscilla sp.]
MPVLHSLHRLHHRSRQVTHQVAPALLLGAIPRLACAQGFEQINTTVLNIQAILVLISIAVVTIAIIWAGFKMIFQSARLADVANVLIGGTLVGGAAAFASFIVTPA